MKLEITDTTVTVTQTENSFTFSRDDEDPDRLEPEFDQETPQEVRTELNNRGFFLCEYPDTFTWRFSSVLYDPDEVLAEIPDGIIQENSPEHDSLYSLVAGDYGGIEVEITVGDDGVCRITDVTSDLPKEGFVRGS